MKRTLFAALLAIPCLALPASAETQPVPKPAPSASTHTQLKWEQQFAQANTSHDGHLTLDQAKTGYISIVRRFADIDTGNKGFVTEDDIRAWHQQQRALRHPAENKLRPRHAFGTGTMARPAVRASASGTVRSPDGNSIVGPDAPQPRNGGAAPG